MAKLPLGTFKIYDLILKGTLYLLAFLFPIFFLPCTSNFLDFNKQALLIGLVFIALFAWMIKVLILGKVRFSLTKLHIPVGVLFLVYLISTLFSLWRYGSFWGWPLTISESLISMVGLLLFYVLVSSALERREVFYLIISFVLSSFLAMIYGVLQLFGRFILPSPFTKLASFNTIGTANTLGLFAAVLLPLMIVLVISSKRVLRGIFVAALVFAAFLIVLINFWVCWWIVIIGSALVMVLNLQKRNFFDSRWLVLPMFFLAVALFFSFFNFQVPGLASRSMEIYLTQKASFNISWETVKEKPLFGSGPGTFVYDFSKHRDASFNEGRFWNLKFERAGSKFLTVLGTTGLLGALSFLALIALFAFNGIKLLFGKLKGKTSAEEEANEKFSWLVGGGIFISFVCLGIAFFLYSSNLTLDFMFFLLMGSFIALFAPIRKEFLLKPSSLLTLVITFSFTIGFISGLGIFILGGQRYIAEANYFQGIKAWAQGDVDLTIEDIERAIKVNPSMDLYWRELSQIYLQKVNVEARREDISQEEINQRVQLYINNAVNSIKLATDTAPQNSINWSVRGYIYQNLIGVVGGVIDWAVKAYDEASKLEPTNPYYPTQAGIVFLTKALLLGEEETEEVEIALLDAKTKFEKAIELKSDYAPARFQLAMTYQAQGKLDESIAELENTRSLAPFDVGLAFQLGLAYYQNGDYENAQLELERAIGISPDYSNALYFLGLAYHKQGKAEKAMEALERVAELNPDNEQAQKIVENLKAGRQPLEGIIEQVPPTVPIEETPEEVVGEEKEGESEGE